MTDDMATVLARIREQADQVAATMRSVRASLPEESSGTDAQGAATVDLDTAGLPVGVRVVDDWQQRVGADALAAAVVEAGSTAARVQGEHLAAALEDPAWQQARPTAAPPAPAPVAVQAVTDPRPLDELAESLIGEMRAMRVGPLTLDAPPTGVGKAADGAVVVRLAQSGLAGCEITPAWAERQTGTAISLALGSAVAAARVDLLSAIESSPAAGTSRRLDGLLSEAMAHLSALLPPPDGADDTDPDTDRTDRGDRTRGTHDTDTRE
ncbi:MAG: hypothetical protein JWP95_529 [Actinotalea sp.]|nr:hypothetical protein [Actinotalea sp.]